MQIIDHLRTLFVYDDWANREAIASLKATSDLPQRPLKLMGHIISTEKLWFIRLQEQKEHVEIWPDSTLEQIEEESAGLFLIWQVFLGDLSLERICETVAYVNSKGEHWENSVQDILMHVIMHSSYHRGQIASDLRLSEKNPANTDYIHWVRQGSKE